MTQSTNKQHRQTQWRERLDRQAQSGQSVAAFCRSEGIAAPTFYWWRARLAKDSSTPAVVAGRPSDAAPFIDLGTLGSTASTAAFDIRLALPGGIILTIAAR
jgi:transposase-like protein